MVLESLIQAWTTFAKTGNPGWARYEAKDKVIKNFDSEDSLRFEIISVLTQRINHISLISALETILIFKQEWHTSSICSACDQAILV